MSAIIVTRCIGGACARPVAPCTRETGKENGRRREWEGPVHYRLRINASRSCKRVRLLLRQCTRAWICSTGSHCARKRKPATIFATASSLGHLLIYRNIGDHDGTASVRRYRWGTMQNERKRFLRRESYVDTRVRTQPCNRSIRPCRSKFANQLLSPRIYLSEDLQADLRCTQK